MATMPYWSASPRTMVPSRPPPSGEGQPSASVSGRRFPAAMRRCSMPRIPSASPCRRMDRHLERAAARLVRIAAGPVTLEGDLSLPDGAHGIVLFAHGSGSSRHSPRNRHVAWLLNQAKLATLLIDLLTRDEE